MGWFILGGRCSSSCCGWPYVLVRRGAAYCCWDGFIALASVVYSPLQSQGVSIYLARGDHVFVAAARRGARPIDEPNGKLEQRLECKGRSGSLDHEMFPPAPDALDKLPMLLVGDGERRWSSSSSGRGIKRSWDSTKFGRDWLLAAGAPEFSIRSPCEAEGVHFQRGKPPPDS